MVSPSSSSSLYLLPGQPLPAPPTSSSSSSPSSGVYSRGTFLVSSLLGQPSYLNPSQKKNKTRVNYNASSTSTTAPPTAITLQARVDSPLQPPHLRLPEPDSIVLCRVTRITSRQAACSILSVLSTTAAVTTSPSPSPSPCTTTTSTLYQTLLSSGRANHAAGEDPCGLDFSGVIRSQDVRLTETDRVKMAECFRVGDLVRAKVISLGDSRSYYLSTASNELGVLFATVSTANDVLPEGISRSSLLPPLLQSAASHDDDDDDLAKAAQDQGALRPLNWQEMIHPATGTREKRKVAKPDGF